MENWIEALRNDCGPLAEAAARFTVREGLDRAELPRGAPALRSLLEAVARQQARSHGDDLAFIEGAGGFLALILAERLGPARHVSHDGRHGLRLGTYGFVDPFAVVEAMLEADDTRRALLAGVAQAEAEARGQAHLCRVMQALEAELARTAEALHIDQRFERRVWLSGADEPIELDLSRVAIATADEPPERMRAAVAHLVAALVGLGDRPPVLGADDRERVLPRLVGPSFVARLPQANGGGAPLHLEPVAGPVQLSLVLQYEGRARYLRRNELPQLAHTAAAARRLALDNLEKRAAATRMAKARTDAGDVVVVRSGDGLDATRLLLPGMRELLLHALGRPVAVGLPHRDLLLACAADDPAATASLARRVAEDARRAPHAICENLLRLDEDGTLTPL